MDLLSCISRHLFQIITADGQELENIPNQNKSWLTWQVEILKSIKDEGICGRWR